ncbi:MAG: hypothetical protein UW24_C0031G0005 [Parcubacteria group bacterium GW2011_GWA2_44_12]|nr:MAG: hypothetical protein UW24_C0031G0005 [Parcubacteria group bacterium GW2011_GWA2_44_12]
MEAGDMKRWLSLIPEVTIIGDVEPIFVDGGHEAMSAPEVWQKVAQEIVSKREEYDGFVVLTSFDTLAYSASALSYMLGRFGKPVIFAGSFIPEDAIEKEMRRKFAAFLEKNKTFTMKSTLINAVQSATMDIGEVGVMFGNVLLRATRAQIERFSKIDFDEDNTNFLGKVDFSFRLSQSRVKRSDAFQKPMVEKFEARIASVHVHPGENGLENVNSSLVKGLFVQCPFVGFLHSFLRGEGAVLGKLPVPVIVYNKGALLKKEDESMKNITVLGDGFYEPLFVKFMWVLSQTSDFQHIKKIMRTEYAGEFGGSHIRDKI